MRAGILYGLSLGPGDPGLVTLKAARLLGEADLVFYAGSKSASGQESSYSRAILDALGVGAWRLRGVFVPMSEDRSVAAAAYASAFAEMLQACRSGMKVAFACEGDISFYSTFARLQTLAKAASLPVEIVAGVPAFLLGAAENGVPLATGAERIAVIPLLRDASELIGLLEDFEVVVLIKIRGVAVQVAELAERHGWELALCEQLGSPAQYISNRPSDLCTRSLPYLSLLIVRRTQA